MFLCLLGLKFYGKKKNYFFFIRKWRMLGLFDVEATMLEITGELFIFSRQRCDYILLFRRNNMLIK